MECGKLDMAVAPYLTDFNPSADAYLARESPMYIGIGVQNPLAAKEVLSLAETFSCRWLVFSDSRKARKLPPNLEPFREKIGECWLYSDRLRLHRQSRDGKGILSIPEDDIIPDEIGVVYRLFPIEIQPARLYLYVTKAVEAQPRYKEFCRELLDALRG